MIKQEIEFEDFDGNKVKEVHYFHLSKSELIDMEASVEGGMAAKLQKIGTSGDGALIINTFKEIISKAYGQRVDGSASQFFKSQQISEQFMGSLAFDQLLTELLTDVSAATRFINGVIPDLSAFVDAAAPQQAEVVELPWANREPTRQELQSMTTTQLRHVYDRKASGWKPTDAA